MARNNKPRKISTAFEVVLSTLPSPQYYPVLSLIEVPLPMKSVGSVLSHFLDRIASDEEIALIFLKELWPQTVGKDLASKSRPLALRDKRLLLAVPSEIWVKELTQLRQMLVHAVNQYWDLRLIEKIDFEVRV
jgi:hypothetical protein